MKRCPNCGTSHDNEDRFCAECGAHLETGLGGLDKDAESRSTAEGETMLTSHRQVSERAKTIALAQQDIDATIRSQPISPHPVVTASASTAGREVATKPITRDHLMIAGLVVVGLGICLLVMVLVGIVIMTYL